MITADQPGFFPKDVLVAVSSREDGTMLDRSQNIAIDVVTQHRRQFCQVNGVAYDDAVYQQVVYSPSSTYDRLVIVDASATTRYSDGIEADGLFTKASGVGLFLPVADCVATVIYDPVKRYLAVLHLGRHSTLTNLLPAAVRLFVDEGSSLSDLVVWLSPSAQRSSYRLDYFADKDRADWRPFCDVRPDGIYLDMQGYNRQRCIDAGVSAAHIHTSPVDTVTNADYFSHAAGDIHGRIAVLAMMR